MVRRSKSRKAKTPQKSARYQTKKQRLHIKQTKKTPKKTNVDPNLLRTKTQNLERKKKKMLKKQQAQQQQPSVPNWFYTEEQKSQEIFPK